MHWSFNLNIDTDVKLMVNTYKTHREYNFLPKSFITNTNA